MDKQAIEKANWVRIDAGDGSKSPVDFSRVLDQVSAAYSDPWPLLWDALHGHQVRCTFASYAVEVEVMIDKATDRLEGGLSGGESNALPTITVEYPKGPKVWKLAPSAPSECERCRDDNSPKYIHVATDGAEFYLCRRCIYAVAYEANCS